MHKIHSLVMSGGTKTFPLKKIKKGGREQNEEGIKYQSSSSIKNSLILHLWRINAVLYELFIQSCNL